MGAGALLAFPIIALLALASSSSSSGSSGTGTTTGGGGGGGTPPPPAADCTAAILGLPSTPGPGGSPSLRDIVNAAMISTEMPAEGYEAMAKSLDTLADSTPDIVLKGNAQVAAACLRARAKTAGKGGGVGGGLPSTASCEDAFKALTPDLQKQIVDARKAGTIDALRVAADTLDGLALIQFDPTVKATMQRVAKCLREAGGGDVGVGKAGPAQKGIASGPDAIWNVRVVAGDYAGKLTEQVFGTGTTTARVNELINQNNPNDIDGLNLGPVRSDWGTPPPPGQANGVLNWTRLPGGAHLRIPKSWNPWIDQQGNRRHGPTPWPSA